MIEGHDVAEPDWTVFDQYPPSELTCQCGAVWHSHSKIIYVKALQTLVHVARTPCPACDKRTTIVRARSSERDSLAYGRGDVGRVVLPEVPPDSSAEAQWRKSHGG